MSTMTERASEGEANAVPEPVAEEPRHAWDMGRPWHLIFTLAMLGMVWLALVSGPEQWRWLTGALMASVIGVYFVFARPLISTDEEYPSGARALAMVAITILPTLPAFMINPTLSFSLVVIAPMLYMTVGSLFATSAMAVLLLLPGLLEGLFGERSWSSVGINLLVNGAIVGYALWFSGWVERIVFQSVERYELIEELRRSREEAAHLSEQAGAMAERERLAREMHDTLAQGFTSIVTLAQAVESELDSDPATARRHLALMRETAAENLAEARAMVAARQAVPMDDDLDGALTRIGERLGRELGIEVTVTVTGVPRALPNHLRVCLLRTAQEALANIRKHAHADRARVTLAHTDVGVHLTIGDDGRGFDTASPSAGNGLVNMRHRAESVGGLWELESTPGSGTTVRLSVPHDETDDHPVLERRFAS